MKFYWIKTNELIKRIFKNYVWDIPNKENKVYLTFDDGPTPDVTEWTLSQLKKYNAKATFFCIGNNIEKHPDIYNSIIQEGHSTGNHTFNHLNGWKSKTEDYLYDVDLCANQIQKSTNHAIQSSIFQTPYGKIKLSQAKKVKELGYKIILWDVLSADFDSTISPEDCLKNVLSNISDGSIVVFHDSMKARKNLEYALPKTLDFLTREGYNFGTIP
ncbi:MAG: polysaccharide deacetylase family protein [Flavobacterium sp.]|nr:polysaccharide deacetylase family protein [Flavobacterium sp.]